MKMRFISLFLILLPIVAVYAQPKHAFFLSTGYSYNDAIELNENVVENSQGLVLTFGGSKKILTYKKTSLELGFAAKTVFATGAISGNSFNSTTLRLAIPVKINFPISKKWEVATGVILQNNADFNTVDWRLRNKYDWRLDILGELKYFIAQDWYVTTSANFNFSSIPDPFFINDPQAAFSVGIGKRILIVNKRKAARKARRNIKKEFRKQKKKLWKNFHF